MPNDQKSEREGEQQPHWQAESLITERRNQRLVERAIRGGWPVPREAKQMATDETVKILKDPSAPRSLRIKAGRALATYAAIDDRDLHHAESLQAQQGIMELKMARAEAGLPNDSVAVTPLPTPAAAPVPAWMSRMGMSTPNEG